MTTISVCGEARQVIAPLGLFFAVNGIYTAPMPKGQLIDLTGQTFGRLTVIARNDPASDRFGQALWRCRCECGKVVAVTGGHLRRGDAHSCGCGRFNDLTGKTFGWLTVLRRVANHGVSVRWRCRCARGKTVTVYGQSLVSGDSRSCGCLCKELASVRAKRDLVGQTFGLLTVVGPAVKRPMANNVYCWQCRCCCGKLIEVRGTGLTSGNTKSCGCRRDTKRKGLA